MKLLVAYVRISRRSAVGKALREANLSGWSESKVEGHGRAAQGHGVEHVRIEVAVQDEQADEVKRLILEAADTGDDVGDGMVLGLPLDFVERL